MSTQLPYRPPTLRLQGLRALDENAVRLFLKLAQQRLRQTWIVLDDNSPVDADVVLASPGTHPLRGQRVVWVTAPGQPVPPDGHGTLQRPLQLEAFYELLQQLKPQPPVACATPVPSLPAPPSSTATRYRLTRWPSSQMLLAHVQGARLASFLSARYLSTTELAQLSHVPTEACSRFIHAMRQHGWVETQSAPSPTAPSCAPTRPAGSAPAWISRLRHKLQLTDTLPAIG